jgi:hypothetical protein
MKQSIFLITIAALSLLSGCTPGSKDTNPTTQVKHCENTFVVSGYGYETALYEHEESGVNFWKLRTLDDEAGNGAFYDCQNNIIVTFLESRQIDKHGIHIYNLDDNTMKVYKKPVGFNAFLYRKNNGIVFASAKVESHALSELKQKYRGYTIPDKYLYTENNVTYYNGVNDYYFDFKTHNYSIEHIINLYDNCEKNNDILYADIEYNDLIKLNLKTNMVESLWPQENRPTLDKNSYLFPANSVSLFVNGVNYILPTKWGWDYEDDNGRRLYKRYKAGYLYAIENQYLSKLIKLPFQDIRYVVSPDKKKLYIFSASRKVVRYDIDNNVIDAEYKINIDLSREYVISTVGYTDHNFILSFMSNKYRESVIVVSDKAFQNYSKFTHFNDSGISITTEKTIQTTSSRLPFL